MDNWKMILSTSNTMEMSLAEAKLHEFDIPYNIINKKDSAYIIIGEAELYVPDDHAEQASKLVASLK